MPFVLAVSVMPIPRPAKVRFRVIRNPRFYLLVVWLLWMTVKVASPIALRAGKTSRTIVIP